MRYKILKPHRFVQWNKYNSFRHVVREERTLLSLILLSNLPSSSTEIYSHLSSLISIMLEPPFRLFMKNTNFWKMAPCASTSMDLSGLGNLITTSLRKGWAALSLWFRTAATLGQKPKVSAFRRLPVEVILDIMGHTASDDLKRLILTEKFMNEIFKTHKTCIFKRNQRYRFPEFVEWFGERSGFDGPVSGDRRTAEQMRCLKKFERLYGLRIVISTPNGGCPIKLMLHSLERYSGWRYLTFLTSVKRRIEDDARHLHRMSLDLDLDMTEEEAKAMVLCFWRMYLNAAADAGNEPGSRARMSEVDKEAEVRMRVENSLKFFQKEPPALQMLMRRTLTRLLFRVARELRLNTTVKIYRRCLQNVSTILGKPGCLDLISTIMAQTLLESFFFYGIGNVLRMCEAPVNVDIMDTQLQIQEKFRRPISHHLRAVLFNTVPKFDSHILEGSLWAAGLEIPIVGWVVQEERIN